MRQPHHPLRSRRRLLHMVIFLTSCGLFAAASGCSLFVMAGKSLLGDPEMEAPFSKSAKVDLREGAHRVIVVASTPEVIKTEFPATTVDLIERVSRKLKAEGVNVVNSTQVASWLDDNGGYWEHIDELVNAFDVEYIIHMEVDQLRLQDPNSPDLYQGFTSGTVYGYEVRKNGTGKTAHRVFHRAFERSYPDGYPKLADRLSRESFHREFMGQIGLILAQMLYDHRASDAAF